MANKEIKWRPGLTLPHDPDEVEDYEIDASALVGESDTLSTVDLLPDEIEAALQDETSVGVIVMRVSGGTEDQAASVTVRLTMASGRIKDRTILFEVKNR